MCKSLSLMGLIKVKGDPASEKWISMIEAVKCWLGWAFCIRNTTEDEILYKMDNVS